MSDAKKQEDIEISQLFEQEEFGSENSAEKQPETDDEDCFIIMTSKSEFNIEKLRDSENYHNSCFAVGNVLTLKGLKKCITEKTAMAGQPAVAEEEDATKLDQAQSILALSVDCLCIYESVNRRCKFGRSFKVYSEIEAYSKK